MPLTFRVCSNVTEAGEIWKALCPQVTIFDYWEYRLSFHVYHKNEVYFIVGETDGQLVGTWPLQVANDGQTLEFFGGDYMEDNRLLLAENAEQKMPGVIVAFYDYLRGLNRPVRLEYIVNNDPFTASLPVKDFKYTLPLGNYRTYQDYIEDKYADHKESRQTLLRKKKHFPDDSVRIVKNNFADMELLFTFVDRMFGPDSSFTGRPFHKEIFRSHQTLPGIEPQLLTFYQGDQVAGISWSMLYKGSYSYANTGLSETVPRDFIVFTNLLTIQNAINLGAHTFDAFTGSYTWKERWYLDKAPQYAFNLPA